MKILTCHMNYLEFVLKGTDFLISTLERFYGYLMSLHKVTKDRIKMNKIFAALK